MSRMYGYPKKTSSEGWILTDGLGKKISEKGQLIGCTPLRPGAPGSWIDSKRCSYRFKVEGVWYSMRGYGEGISAGGRAMKKPPRGFSGARRR